MKHIYPFLILFFMFSICGAYAFPEQVKDLEKSLQKASDTEKPAIYLQLAKTLRNDDLKKAIKNASKAEKLSRKAGNQKLQLESLFLLAELEKTNGRFSRASRHAHSAKDLALSLNDRAAGVRALAFLKTSYTLAKDTKNIQKTMLELQKVQNVLDFENLKKDYASQQNALDYTLSENERINLEKLRVEGKLDTTLLEKFLVEKRMDSLAREKDQLDLRAARLENDSIRNELEAEKRDKEIAENKQRIRFQGFLLLITLVGLGATFFISVLVNRNSRLKRKQAEEKASLEKQLMQKDKMATLGQVTAGIAHEIKNPLNFVNNFAEGSSILVEDLEEVLDGVKSKISNEALEEIEELVEEIKINSKDILSHGTRADRIVNSMMEHARGEKGSLEPTNLNQLVQDNVSLAYNGYRGNHASFQANISYDLDEKLPAINIIPQDIARVILNLINNACDALDEKKAQHNGQFEPTLKISTQNEGKQLLLRIADNGPGISPENQKQIFNPFFTTKPTGQGNTGLGLSMSYDIIVEGHQGEMRVESTEGEGAEFVIALPKK